MVWKLQTETNCEIWDMGSILGKAAGVVHFGQRGAVLGCRKHKLTEGFWVQTGDVDDPGTSQASMQPESGRLARPIVVAS